MQNRINYSTHIIITNPGKINNTRLCLVHAISIALIAIACYSYYKPHANLDSRPIKIRPGTYCMVIVRMC